jgi:hypothetical protein
MLTADRSGYIAPSGDTLAERNRWLGRTSSGNYAGGKGYNFSVTELAQWGSKNPNIKRELSGADLDEVVGGVTIKHELLGHY